MGFNSGFKGLSCASRFLFSKHTTIFPEFYFVRSLQNLLTQLAPSATSFSQFSSIETTIELCTILIIIQYDNSVTVL